MNRKRIVFLLLPFDHPDLELPTMKPPDLPKYEAGTAQSLPLEGKAALKEPDEAKVVIDFSNVVIELLFTDFVNLETFSKSDFHAVKVLE